MGLEPNYIVVDGQTFNKAKLGLDNHVYKNCQIDDCDLYYSGGQYELIDTHITNSRLILNHPAKGIYHALQTLDLLSYWPDCSYITPRDWNKLCLDKVRSLDFINLQENCDVTHAGRQYAQLKTTSGQEKYLMRHDRHSMLIKFWLRASCLGLRARVEHDDDADKICVLCNSGEQETERHFLLDCAAFAHERQVFWT